MSFLRPKSILRLILTGFLLVALPLMVALAVVTLSVDKLVTRGQEALLQSVFVTQGSQVAAEAIRAMERNGRQYQVLGDQVIFDVYKENHARFLDTVRGLESQKLTTAQEDILLELKQHELELHDVLTAYGHDAPETEKALEGFVELGRMAQQILLETQDLITRGAERMQEQAERVQRTLLTQAFALIPAVVILMVLFTVLISRPVRQIDQAIRRMGDGTFTGAAEISGPRDLEQLGERLDWLRQKLLAVEQDKKRFLQHISHELKTPLTAIREGSELLSEQIVGELNEQQLEIAGILQDNSVQLQKLIEDLLNFSIVQSRSAGLARSEVDLAAVVEDVLSDHRITMMSRQLQLESLLQPVRLIGDRDKLRILVDNLVSNAVKYSPDGSTLSVVLSEAGDKAVLRVTDAGPGIPETDRERVFEAFYQGAPADKGAVRGTGLGLSIAREYVLAHGGTISVLESEQTGATLEVVLPLKQEKQA